MVETFSSDRVAFRILSNVNDTAPPRKQPTALTRWLFLQKSPTTDFQPDSKCRSDWGCYKLGVGWVDYRCMEFVAAAWCTRTWLRLYQTIRNLTSGDLGILLVVIELGVTGLKKTKVVYLLDLFEGRGEKGQCDLMCLECLQIYWVNGGFVNIYSRVVSVVLVLWGVGPILRNGYGN